MSISFDTMRVGKKYYLINHGDRHDFFVIEKLNNQNFKLKDIYTLEFYELEDLVRYGKGKDYELYERE
jgi:hypothetical protein